MSANPGGSAQGAQQMDAAVVQKVGARNSSSLSRSPERAPPPPHSQLEQLPNLVAGVHSMDPSVRFDFRDSRGFGDPTQRDS